MGDIRWLDQIGGTNDSYGVSDMPTEAPVPVGYSIALYYAGGQ